MGRPKINEPKNALGRVRLKDKEMKEIIAKYGTFTKFVEAAVKTMLMLSLITFASCGSSGRDPLPGETFSSGAVNYLTNSLLYSCNGSNCWVSGKIGTEEIQSGDFHFTGNIYYEGQICTISGCEDYRLAPSMSLIERI